jgi:4-hydroxybenzoate polyprenyltransferase
MSFKALITLLRPQQWVKNLMLFFPSFMGGTILQPAFFQKAILPFAAFCLASSATYIFNDFLDREKDRAHPKKKNRPIASGRISLIQAILLGVFLTLAAVGLSLTLPGTFLAWLIAYLGLSLAYSLFLKNQPIFDIFCIASGFVFRLFAGGSAFGVEVSDWLFLSVLLLALFLSSGKRLGEKALLGESSGDHRKALDDYPPGVLESFMYISGASVLVTYTLYVITMHRLVFSVPFCCFGIFRYLFLVKSGSASDPTESLIKDPLLFLTGLSWVGMVMLYTYFP